MKKIYFWALGIGIIIGISYLFLRKEFQKDEIVRVQNENKVNVMSGQKTEVGVKSEGNKEIKEQVMGEIIKWESKEGMLTVKLGDKEEELEIIPEEMVIYVPVPQKKTNQIILVNSKETKDWETAFCPKDTVTFGYDESKTLRMVVNTGYRSCGQK